MFVVVVGLFRMERSGGLYVIPNILLSFMFIFNTSLLRNAGQKGKVMEIFRSLWALARAIGPVVSCTGKRSVLIGSPLGHLILYINLKYYNKPT